MRFTRAAGALLVVLGTIGSVGLAAGPASASSWVQYYNTNTPPANTSIFGPGCPQTPENNFGSSGPWTQTGGDYPGCNGTSYYVTDQSTQTAQFRWHVNFTAGCTPGQPCIKPNYCNIYVYIPT